MYGEDRKVSAIGFWESALGSLLKGVIWAICLTFLLLTVCALVLTYTSLSEELIPVLSMICVVVSSIVGGVKASKMSASKGYLKGALSGAVYILVLYMIASLISEKFIFTNHTLLLFAVSVLAGAIGGVIGINTTSKRKR